MLAVISDYVRQWSGRSNQLVEGLLEAAQTLAGDSLPDAKFSHLCESTVRMIGCDRSSIFMRDGDRMRGRYNYGNPDDIADGFLRLSLGSDDPMLAAAISSGSYVIANDAPNDPLMNRELARSTRIRAIAIAPIFDRDGQPYGFMTAEYNENRGNFSNHRSSILLGLAKLSETVVHSVEASLEREELSSRIALSDRLDALARMSAGLAHDLNNRLTVILGVTELLQLRHGDEGFEPLRLAAQASAELTRRLLEFARGAGDLETEPTDVSRVLTEFEDTCRSLVSERCELRLTVQPHQIVVCSASQIERILLNLVTNARDASLDSGLITVDLYRSEERGQSGPAGEIVLEVSDQGAGIAPKDMPHIFEPFFTTKAAGSGTGLGLASAHGIVSSLGGRIDVVSTPGSGALFRVLLPAPANSQIEQASEPKLCIPLAVGPLLILLVDDDDAVRDVMARVLENSGHEVLQAASGIEALAVASRLLERPDVLVSDMVMPEMSGFELVIEMRNRYPELPVLFVSAYIPPDLRAESPTSGPTTFLAKPFSPQLLFKKLNYVMDPEYVT